MQCPRDDSVLLFQESERVVGQVCSKCRGVFLEGKGVAAFKYNHQTDILEKIFRISPQVKTNIRCPCCKTKMILVSVDSIELDICKQCQGIWFDEKEVSKMIKNHSPPPNLGGKDAIPYNLVEIIANILSCLN